MRKKREKHILLVFRPSGAAGEPLIKVTEKTTEGTLGPPIIDKKTGKKIYLMSGQLAREGSKKINSV